MKSVVSMLSLLLVALATLGAGEPETGTSVFVKSPNGALFNLPVELTDTVKAVKMKIQEKEKIAASKQRLFFNAKELDDEMTLEHYKIHNHSVLKLVVTKTTGDDSLDIPEASVRIFIKTMNLHKTIAMTVDLTETVKTLKASIETKEKIPTERQRLFFGAQQLEDEKTLASYKIQNDSTIRLFIHGQESTQIFVKKLTEPKKTIALTVDLSQTVEKLKATIEIKETIPVKQQYLLFGSKLMEDKRTLLEYNVKQNSTIQMLALPKCISDDN